MVKIARYKKQTGVTKQAPNTLSGLRYNPADFSRASDAIGQVGKSATQVGMNLLQQDEENKMKLLQQKEENKLKKMGIESEQEIKLIATLDKQANDFFAIKTKLDRSNKLSKAIDEGMNGIGDALEGLNAKKQKYQNSPDYLNSEKYFADEAKILKETILASIDDLVVKQDFIEKFDTKIDSYGIDVMNGAFKIGLAQRTAAYKKEEESLLYDLEYGNEIDKIAAQNRLLGLNNVQGIHEQAFEEGIINASPEIAEYYSKQQVEYIKAKLVIANDPAEYLEIAKGDPDYYPFPELTLAQRADLDIAAQKALQVLNNKKATHIEKVKNENIKNVNTVVKDLEDGNMPFNGLEKLSMAKAIAEELGDTDTIAKIDDYMEMYATFNIAIQMNQSQIADELNVVNSEINKLNAAVLTGEPGAKGVSRELLLKQIALTSVSSNMNSSLNDDSLKWASQTGLFELKSVDWVNATDEDFDAWVIERKAQNNLTRFKYATKDNFLTKEDQRMIMNAWQDPDTTNDQKIFLIKRLASFGEDADKVFAEILYKGDGKKEAKYFAHIAGLMNTKGFDIQTGSLALNFFNGFEMRDNDSIPSAVKMFGTDTDNDVYEARKEFTELTNGSLHNVSSNFMETVFDMAKIVYVDRDKTNKTTAFNKELFSTIVEELLGSTTINGVKHGGIGEFNGQATVIPSWMQTDNFEELISNLSYGDLAIAANGQTPEWKYGEKGGEFKLNDLFSNKDDQRYLWVVDDGKYIVSFASPMNNEDPQYIGTSHENGVNGYFILDLNLIKDKIISSYK